MARYLLIESRDPFDGQDSLAFYGLARGLAMKGNKVTLFLIQNGVLPARQRSKYAGHLAEIAKERIAVLADDFSLRERSIRHLAEGVRMSGVEELVDLIMAEGTKTIWH